MSLNKYKIAIDGPSGAGKSTIAKKVATALKIDYIDTGAMYRALAYKILQEEIAIGEKKQLSDLLDRTEIDFSDGNILLDGEIVNDKIRTPEVTKMASECSALALVRTKLVDLQRKMGQGKSIIMDGRDIGTVVLADAEYKFFLTASAHERAVRRYQELLEKGQSVSLESVETEMVQRDYNDTHREITPLKKAEDAEEIDSTTMGIEDVVEHILKRIRN